MANADWTGKRVLVTGADGFIGSHLAEMLAAGGAAVRALAFYNSFNHWGWLDDVADRRGIDVVCGDVRDPGFVASLVRGSDVVFHLAALIAIPYSYLSPQSYIETNVKGTLHLCQAAVEYGCRRFVHVSTSEVYGTARAVPIGEDHPLQPQSPYAASKVGADALAWSFHRSFSLPLVIARPFNTYGPRQSARAVIPTIITRLAGGASSLPLGNLEPTRDFTFVTDTCRGLAELAACDGALGEVVHIGSDSEISIGRLAATIAELMGVRAEVTLDPQRLRPPASEVERLRCDNRKLRRLTGFAPAVPLADGLRQTIAWYRDPRHLHRFKSDLYNL